MDARTTRVFFLFYFDAIRLPLVRLPLPRLLQRWMLLAARRLLLRPLLAQDGAMVEAEQHAYERTPYTPSVELSPLIAAFQTLIIGQWRQHLAQSGSAKAGHAPV